jgi:hypothetical protein
MGLDVCYAGHECQRRLLRPWIRCGLLQGASCLCKLGLLAAVGQHPIVTDALDAPGQDVQHEAADELFNGQPHLAFAT